MVMVRVGQAWAVVLLAVVPGCAPQSVLEVLNFATADRDPDGDGSLATARPLVFVGDTARASAGIALDESFPGLVRSFLGIQRGRFVPGPGEADLFALGRLERGDQIDLTLLSVAKPLGQLLAGSDQALLAMVLDEGEVIAGFPESAGVVIRDPGRYFLMVTSTAVGAPYDLIVHRARDRSPVPPRQQVVLLEFGGGRDLDLVVPTGGLAVRLDSVPPLEAAAIDPLLAGQDQLLKQTVALTVRAIYADYDVIVVTDRAEAEQMGDYSTLLITAALPTEVLHRANLATAGVEPRLDFENVDHRDVGLVFAGLQGHRSTVLRGAYAVGVQIGLIAAHELGHALGLLHVLESSGGLMRPVVAVDAFTAGELWPKLVRAPLAEARVGVQDGPAYLERVVGLRDPAEAEAIRQEALLLRPAVQKLSAAKAAGQEVDQRCWRCGLGR